MSQICVGILILLLIEPHPISLLQLVRIGAEQKRERSIDDRLSLHLRRDRVFDDLLQVGTILIHAFAVAHPVIADCIGLLDPVASSPRWQLTGLPVLLATSSSR